MQTKNYNIKNVKKIQTFFFSKIFPMYCLYNGHGIERFAPLPTSTARYSNKTKVYKLTTNDLTSFSCPLSLKPATTITDNAFKIRYESYCIKSYTPT